MVSFCLTLPKFVVLKNTRLALFCTCVRLVMIGLLASSFLHSNQFADEVPIQGMQVSMWATHHASPEILEQMWNDAAESPLCKTPNIYDYWDGSHKYETHGCKKLCRESDSSESSAACTNERLYVHENQDQVFFITRQEISTGSSRMNPSAVFFPQVLASGLGMSFNYNVHVPRFEFPWFLRRQWNEHVGSSRRNVFTAVIDAKGRVNRTMEPKVPIEFTLLDLLWLSGIADFLDVPDTTKRPNTKPNATLHHPLGRVSGGTIAIRIHCSNTPRCRNCEDERQELQKAWSSGAYDTICTLRVALGYDHWAYREKPMENSEGSAMLLSRQGLRATCQRDGAFEYLEWRWICLLLSSWIVWLRVADFLVQMIVVRCFGLISSMYRHAVYDVFDIRETVAGMTARLMVATVIFDILQDRQQQGITEDRAKAQIRRVLGDRRFQIDEREKSVFASFCWEAQMLRHFKVDEARSREFHRSTHHSPSGAGPLDVDNFSIAFSNFERLSFDSLVKVFDRDRSKGILETLATPKHLSSAITRAQLVTTRHGKAQGDVAVTLSPAAHTSGRSGQESEAVEQKQDEAALQSEAPQFTARNKTFAEEALWKAQEALAEVAGLRKSIDARMLTIEANIGLQTESRLPDLERKMEQFDAKQEQFCAQAEIDGKSHETLFSDVQRRLSQLEHLFVGQRFEQLEDDIREFQNKCQTRLERMHEKFQDRIGRWEDFTKRLALREDHITHHDVVETKDLFATPLPDHQGDVKDVQQWFVDKIAECMDDGRASREALEKQIQVLGTAVSNLENKVLATDTIDIEGLWTGQFSGTRSNGNDEAKLSTRPLAQEHIHRDRIFSAPLELRLHTESAVYSI